MAINRIIPYLLSLFFWSNAIAQTEVVSETTAVAKLKMTNDITELLEADLTLTELTSHV